MIENREINEIVSRLGSGNLTNGDITNIACLIAELMTYRAQIKDERLLKLPCKIGSTVYEVDGNFTIPYEVVGYRIGRCVNIEDFNYDDDNDDDEYNNNIEATGVYIQLDTRCGMTMEAPISDIGKNIFFTDKTEKPAQSDETYDDEASCETCIHGYFAELSSDGQHNLCGAGNCYLCKRVYGGSCDDYEKGKPPADKEPM